MNLEATLISVLVHRRAFPSFFPALREVLWTSWSLWTGLCQNIEVRLNKVTVIGKMNAAHI